MPKKRSGGIFRNIFSRNNDKIIVKKFPLSKSEDNECIASLLYEESATPTDPLCSTRGPKGIADSSEFTKVIANIERNTSEANNPYGIMHKHKVDCTAAAFKRRASHEKKDRQNKCVKR
ncbi:hypothetical protein MRX96_034475 [Rhipicephalus microplus]